ncbi:Helix-turn-helix [Sphingomonas gellani]|uniref:Helix-turn-helix n=1 Tax=Sphingomonas gellani TaxID=1166340 RepID=A0A1H8ASY5_9SPHN|nr:helix-turn-helix domain-containing protein [Sphingomonas gellani]SEM73074.1 Helix-turn-helix [Sphingomonas gellani]
MRLGERIAERRLAKGFSQSALARRSGLSQATIGKLEAGISSGSSHLHRIARELGTTPEYLTGEINDPEVGAPPPLPSPMIQHLLMPVALPSEAALTEMYEAQLKALARLEGAELAHALAKRLPRALARLQGAELYEESDSAPEAREAPAPPATDHHEPRRARRT